MSEEWYLLNRPLFNSGLEDDEFLAFGRDGFEEVLESSLADDIEIYEKRLDVKPLLTRAVVQGVTSDTYNNSVLRQFLCRIGTLRSGQYIRVNGCYWMVNSLPDNNKVYEKAVAWQCKHNIRFISPVSGKVVEYPVYDLNSTQYGSGETNKTHISVGSANHLVYIPYNDETIRIDSGFRFLIDKNREDPTAYRVAQVDPMSYSCGENDGLIQWTIVENQYDDRTDSKELMIADFYGKSEQPDIGTTDVGTHVILSTDDASNTITFGEESTIHISYMKDGADCDSFPLDISIVDGAEFGSIIETDEDHFVLRALNNRKNIGQEMTVSVRNEEQHIDEQITLRIKGWY